MKKIIAFIICLFISVNLIGCSVPKTVSTHDLTPIQNFTDDKFAEHLESMDITEDLLASPDNATPAVLPKDAVVSPDGRFAVCANIQENQEDENGAYYSIFDVQLYDTAKKTMICTYHIIGRDFRFL